MMGLKARGNEVAPVSLHNERSMGREDFFLSRDVERATRWRERRRCAECTWQVRDGKMAGCCCA
jgi:hypothetical protein